MRWILKFVCKPLSFLVFLLIPTTLMANTLEPCPNKANTRWHECFGLYTYNDKSEYLGEWQNNAPNGQGSYTKPNGFLYVGEFANGNFNGLGTATWSDGTRYIGSWKDNKFHGNGSLISSNGDTETGQWTEGTLQKQISTASPSKGEDYETANKNLNAEDKHVKTNSPDFTISPKVKTDIPQNAIVKVIEIIREMGAIIEFEEPIHIDGSIDRKIIASTDNIKFFETLFKTMKVNFIKDRDSWDYKIIFPDELEIITSNSDEITSSSVDEISINGSFQEKELKPTKLEILARDLNVQTEDGFMTFEEVEVEQQFDNREKKQSYSHSADLRDLHFKSPDVEIILERFSMQSEIDFRSRNSNISGLWGPFLPDFNYLNYLSLFSMASQVNDEISIRDLEVTSLEGNIQFKRFDLSSSLAPKDNEINRVEVRGILDELSLSNFDDIPKSALPYIPNLLRFDITVEANRINFTETNALEALENIYSESNPFEKLEISEFLISSDKFSIDINGNLKADISSSLGVVGNLEINIVGLNGLISEFQKNLGTEMMPVLPVILMIRGLSNADPENSSKNATDDYNIEIQQDKIFVNGTDLSSLIPQ